MSSQPAHTHTRTNKQDNGTFVNTLEFGLNQITKTCILKLNKKEHQFHVVRGFDSTQLGSYKVHCTCVCYFMWRCLQFWRFTQLNIIKLRKWFAFYRFCYENSTWARWIKCFFLPVCVCSVHTNTTLQVFAWSMNWIISSHFMSNNNEKASAWTLFSLRTKTMMIHFLIAACSHSLHHRHHRHHRRDCVRWRIKMIHAFGSLQPMVAVFEPLFLRINHKLLRLSLTRGSNGMSTWFVCKARALRSCNTLENVFMCLSFPTFPISVATFLIIYF